MRGNAPEHEQAPRRAGGLDSSADRVIPSLATAGLSEPRRTSKAATIVSVADAFDAMTSNRPYRSAKSPSAAVQEIVAGSGKQFSPRVANALIRLRRRKMLPLPQRHALEEEAA